MSQQQIVNPQLWNSQTNSAAAVSSNSADPFDLFSYSDSSPYVRKDRLGRKITTTDLLTWSRIRNVQCKQLYHCLRPIERFYLQHWVNGKGDKKNVLTIKEFDAIQAIRQQIVDLIKDFKTRTKELKQQEFGI